MKLPILIKTKKAYLNGYAGISFFIWIWVATDSLNFEKTKNHETIHFYQQLEMLFIPMWIIYILSYIWNLFKYAEHHKAYLNIPFEKEAYANDKNFDYLKIENYFLGLDIFNNQYILSVYC